MSNVVVCTDLKNVPGKPSCCSSCHDDEDEYGDYLLEIEDTYRVCCTVATWLDTFTVKPVYTSQFLEEDLAEECNFDT